MTEQTFDPMSMVAGLENVVEDQTVAKAGGGGYTLPEAGVCGLRFIEYIELGKYDAEFKGEKKVKEQVFLKFEIHGAKWPVDAETGKPQTFGFFMDKSLTEKSKFFKLFGKMNYSGKAKHMAQLLGQAFMGTIHRVTKGEGDAKKEYANLYDKDGVYSIKEPFFEDPITNERRELTVPAPSTPIKLFLWDHATKPMWDSIYIDGMTDPVKNDKGEVVREAKSKNWLQEKIKAAKNYPGSPLQAIVEAGGEPNLGEAIQPERSGAAADPLAA
ncbi:hypothetical protein [Caulobacter phage DCM]|uniref:Uncharacterized protein n=1 Tax=Caulobacter phage DCM TaxID=3020391 RepID=A0AAE9WWY1_9CAUD|nr:hypothetical protein [Caulobacter phage DCM]WCD56104.1 hypothetical protein [Caulobacter phage BL199]